MSNFTKGPWTCVEVEFGDYQTGNVSFVVDSLGGKEVMVGSVANCSLIAAAPDMYDLLLSVRPEIESSIETPCGDLEPVFSKECRILLSNIDKVLVKARGESPEMPLFEGTREALSKLSIGGDE